MFSTEHACKALKQFILQRLVPNRNDEWTESAVITLLWMSTSGKDQSVDVEVLESWLGDIHRAWDRGLSAEAAHGALVLVWKKIEKASDDQSSGTAIRWCCLALQKLFEKAGEHNVGKVERKLINCYLASSNFEAARGVLEKMSMNTKGHRLTRYLAYCVAIRSCDDDMG